MRTHGWTVTFHCLYVGKLSISKNKSHCALLADKSAFARQHRGKRTIDLQKKRRSLCWFLWIQCQIPGQSHRREAILLRKKIILISASQRFFRVPPLPNSGSIFSSLVHIYLVGSFFYFWRTILTNCHSMILLLFISKGFTCKLIPNAVFSSLIALHNPGFSSPETRFFPWRNNSSLGEPNASR